MKIETYEQAIDRLRRKLAGLPSVEELEEEEARVRERFYAEQAAFEQRMRDDDMALMIALTIACS